MKETCPECGSDDLEFKAWVDKNKEFVEFVDDGVRPTAYCRPCGEIRTIDPL